MMNLAIVHYHLNRGGVARVIENQLLALDAVLDPGEPWRVAILHGGRRHGWNDALAERLRAIDLRLVEVAGLDYDEPADEGSEDNEPDRDDPMATTQVSPATRQDNFGAPGPDSTARKHVHASVDMAPDAHSDTRGNGDLVARILGVLGQLGFAPERTVVQIHNHSLGKNVALAAGVGALAGAGYRLLLQIHDFAEDFRPANYRRLAARGAETIYPQAAGIHYAVLNGRDREILRAAGVVDERLHWLPNPVPTLGALPDRTAARQKLESLFGVGPGQRFLLYPIRCIRRKNVGEALLAGVLSPPETVVGLTLAPLNPVEASFHEAWKQTAAQWNLPCRFEVGGPGAMRFEENVSAADAMITTSVAEGFGMVMLESWPAGRAVVGRDLPEITTDFTGAGLRLDWLWDRLSVPVEWVGRERFVEAASEAYRRAVAAYDWPLPDDWRQKLADKTHGGAVDFGDLDETMQRDALRNVLDRADGRKTVFAHNPGLEALLAVDAPAAAATIEHNVGVIERRYSLVPSGRRLAELLLRIVDGPRGGPIAPPPHPERILDGFLDTRRFRMIRG
ncbi:MAG: hypothetical protein JW719_14290 [Pirellulales bacterium]|nr:hypothetical protein [Pirellulales bacterium]